MIKPKDQLAPIFLEYTADFETCEKVIKKHSKSFYQAFSQLPKQKALSIFAIYSFCREADDSIDVFNDPARLNQLQLELNEFLLGNTPNRPFWRALVPVFMTYKMNEQAFYDMLIGQKKDIIFKQPQTQTELEEYSYFVAGAVGLMLLPILSNVPNEIEIQAIKLGQAMQLTNILRDVGEDERNGRIYFPKEVMDFYGVSAEDLKQGTINDAFIDMWEFEAQRAEQLYQESLSMIEQLEADAQEALLLSLIFYRAILDAVRKNEYDCFTKRSYVKKHQQIRLYQAVKAQLKEQ